MASRINLKTAKMLENVYENLEYNNGKIIERSILEDEHRWKLWYIDISRFFKIVWVEKIHNPYLKGMYLLNKEEMINDDSFGDVKEMTLLHATSYANAITIATQNIDWRKTRRSRFGIGSNFSPSPGYAHRYSSSDGVCKVLVKRVEEIAINYDLEIPSMEYDTVSGNDGMVFVKFDDFTFYPKYIVHYERR